jgi:hypothetical protein
VCAPLHLTSWTLPNKPRWMVAIESSGNVGFCFRTAAIKIFRSRIERI